MLFHCCSIARGAAHYIVGNARTLKYARSRDPAWVECGWVVGVWKMGFAVVCVVFGHWSAGETTELEVVFVVGVFITNTRKLVASV